MNEHLAEPEAPQRPSGVNGDDHGPLLCVGGEPSSAAVWLRGREEEA